ncbi:hypothetical protein [Dietzia alimentaria]|uniref:hypothetical protein n=1 Tax=Dietzia alimentaria TaxID=665550 RepID=UPI0011453F21|nr:hypothetical protein [Dietzia alimentaria]
MTSTPRFWTFAKVSGSAFLWFFAALFIIAATRDYLETANLWSLTLGICLSAIGFSAPIFGYTLRNRPEQIRAPQVAALNGLPAVLFPADRPAVPVSAALYAILSGALVSWAMLSDTDEARVAAGIFLALAAFFFSYTLFAVLGRFHDDGTYLTEQGVFIRARGLRAQIPWSSIAGSRTYKKWPFPYPRIAIDLIPGTPRDVSITVPWWIGSPHPRKNTVILTTVQVPALQIEQANTDPGTWIDTFIHNPPTARYLATLVDPPNFYEARTMTGSIPPPFSG